MNTIQKIIVYFGVKDTGKTTILNMLIKMLTENTEYKLIKVSPYFLHTEKIDKKVVIEHIKTKILIGITTAGDYDEITQESLDFFKNEKVQIAITTSRTRGETCHTITRFIKTNKIEKLWWIGAGYPTSHAIPKFSTDRAELDNYNPIMANTLFNTIEIELKNTNV